MFKIKPATRYPADPRAVFVLSLSILAGVPLFFGATEAGSVEALVPGWAVVTWGACLTGGAIVTLAGMTRQTVGGIVAEQVGSVAVGAASIFYAAAICLTVGGDGALAVATILGWGLSCLYRWLQLQALLRGSEAQARHEATR